MSLLLWTMARVLQVIKDLCKFLEWYGITNKLLLTCRCAVHWGDGSPPEVKRLKDFGPCQIAHQYPKENNHYLVMAFYCSSPVRCDCYVRSIDTSYDPGNIGISV